MILIRASKGYFVYKLSAFLKRLDNVTQDHEINPHIPESSIFSVWCDIGRYIILASELLTDQEYYEVLALLQNQCPGIKPREFRNHYIRNYPGQHSQD